MSEEETTDQEEARSVTNKHVPPPDPLDKLALVALCIACAITGLIIFVTVVGVLQGNLNPTAVATMLGGVLTTIVGVLFTTIRKDKEK